MGLAMEKTPSHLLAASQTQFQRLKKQYMVFKLLQQLPSINHGAVTAFHTETSSFSHPCRIPCPPALTQCHATFLPPAYFILSATTGGLQWFFIAVMGGSFGEQQGLGSDPAQPFKLQGVPQAEPQCSSHTQAAGGAALSTTEEKPSANLLVGQEEKLI